MAEKKEHPAKIYLMEIEKLDIKINQKCDMLSELRTNRFNVQAVDFSKEKVKSSTKNNVNNLSDKLLDLENEINEDIDNFYDMKNKIINEIHQLNKKDHIKVLHKKYIEYKSLELIAVEMNYSYRHVKRLHGYALNDFLENVLRKRCPPMSP